MILFPNYNPALPTLREAVCNSRYHGYVPNLVFELLVVISREKIPVHPPSLHVRVLVSFPYYHRVISDLAGTVLERSCKL